MGKSLFHLPPFAMVKSVEKLRKSRFIFAYGWAHEWKVFSPFSHPSAPPTHSTQTGWQCGNNCKLEIDCFRKISIGKVCLTASYQMCALYEGKIEKQHRKYRQKQQRQNNRFNGTDYKFSPQNHQMIEASGKITVFRVGWDEKARQEGLQKATPQLCKLCLPK